MIFVTVGTHEQPFDRLLKRVDQLKGDGVFGDEEVIIQTGYSNYVPAFCTHQKLFPYKEMDRLFKEARIVITHGGPSSFLAPLQLGKVPIVVPRQKQFGEHVNDHQLEFAREVYNRQKNILLVEQVEDLADIILQYDSHVRNLNGGLLKEKHSHNAAFMADFERLVEELMQ